MCALTAYLKECHAAAKNASDIRPGGADIVKDAKDDLNKSVHHTQGAKRQAEADSGMEESKENPCCERERRQALDGLMAYPPTRDSQRNQ